MSCRTRSRSCREERYDRATVTGSVWWASSWFRRQSNATVTSLATWSSSTARCAGRLRTSRTAKIDNTAPETSVSGQQSGLHVDKPVLDVPMNVSRHSFHRSLTLTLTAHCQLMTAVLCAKNRLPLRNCVSAPKCKTSLDNTHVASSPMKTPPHCRSSVTASSNVSFRASSMSGWRKKRGQLAFELAKVPAHRNSPECSL